MSTATANPHGVTAGDGSTCRISSSGKRRRLEAASHRELRRQRQQDRIVLHFAAAVARLSLHHGSSPSRVFVELDRAVNLGRRGAEMCIAPQAASPVQTTSLSRKIPSSVATPACTSSSLIASVAAASAATTSASVITEASSEANLVSVATSTTSPAMPSRSTFQRRVHFWPL